MFPVIRNPPGGKGGRCVWLTTYHHYSAVVTKAGSLNSPGPLRAYMASWGRLYLYLVRATVQDAGFYITKTQRRNKSTRHSTALKSRACSAVHYVN